MKKENVGLKLVIASIFTFIFPYFGIPILLFKYFMGRNKTSKRSYQYEYDTEIVRDKRFKGGYREQLGNQKKLLFRKKCRDMNKKITIKKIKGYLYIALGFSAFWIFNVNHRWNSRII